MAVEFDSPSSEGFSLFDVPTVSDIPADGTAEFASPTVDGAAVFDAPQFGTAAVAPTGVITVQDVDGQTVTLSGTTANVPTSGMGSLTATGNGAVTQGPINLTLGADTFTITFAEVPAGDYTPNVSLSNSGGSNPATGGTTVSITSVSGGGSIGIDLLGASSLQGSVSSSAAISRTIGLAAGNASQGNAASAGNVLQRYLLVGSNVTQASTAATGLIGHVHVMKGTGDAQGSTATTASVTQFQEIYGGNSSQESVATGSVVTVDSELIGASSSQINLSSSAVIQQIIAAGFLTADATTQDAFSQTGTITMITDLSGSSSIHTPISQSGALYARFFVDPRRLHRIAGENRRHAIPAESRSITN